MSIDVMALSSGSKYIGILRCHGHDDAARQGSSEKKAYSLLKEWEGLIIQNYETGIGSHGAFSDVTSYVMYLKRMESGSRIG